MVDDLPLAYQPLRRRLRIATWRGVRLGLAAAAVGAAPAIILLRDRPGFWLTFGAALAA